MEVVIVTDEKLNLKYKFISFKITARNFSKSYDVHTFELRLWVFSDLIMFLDLETSLHSWKKKINSVLSKYVCYAYAYLTQMTPELNAQKDGGRIFINIHETCVVE